MRNTLLKLLQTIRRLFAGTGIGANPFIARSYKTVLAWASPKQDQTVRIGNHRFYIDSKSGGLHKVLLEEGVYEPETTKWVERNITPGMTVVDVGANIGYFSIIAAKQVGASGKVYSVEPDAWNQKTLKKNAEVNGYGDRIQIEPLCLSDHDGTLTFYRDATNHGNHSVGRANIVTLQEETTEPCQTLDTLVNKNHIQKIDVMKMDTQGAELAILQGATKVLETMPPKYILLEFWPFGLKNAGADPAAVLQILRSRGYKLSDMDAPETDLTGLSDEALIEKAASKKQGKGWLDLLAFHN